MTSSTSAGSRRTTICEKPSLRSGGDGPSSGGPDAGQLAAHDRHVDDRPAGRAAFLAKTVSGEQVEDDGDRRDARPPRPWRPTPRRAMCCTLVASTTVRRRSPSRADSVRWSSANAALVAAWSASSPETIARKRSDERISSAAKWRAANVDLPAPAAPTRTTRLGSSISISTVTYGGRAPDLVAAAVGGADLVDRLVVDRRSAADVAVGQPEARAVPGALDAAVDDGPLGERPAGVRADRVQRVDGVADADQHQVVDAGLRLGRRRLGKRREVRHVAGVELDPLRPGAAERVAADHVAQDVDDVAADERAGGDEEEARSARRRPRSTGPGRPPPAARAR